MNLKDVDFDALHTTLAASLSAVKTAADLEMLKRDWLSKDGTIKVFFKQLRDVDPADKPAVAGKLNELKAKLETFVSAKEEELSRAGVEKSARSEFIDLSLPSHSPGLGGVSLITRIERKIFSILKPFGFENVYGPEVETDYYCFDSLNIPPHHPARDMQDTFYTSNGHVLRTHTTSVQARTLQLGKLPVKVASPGRVYRNETEDASHQAMFHQFELVWVEEGLTLSNLMALINLILKGLYGKRTKVRFTPRFYPYTEPSIGPQIDCALCHGKGCSLCGGSGWLTVAGAGMVHRNVLKEFNYDPDKVSGFAFGLGTSRLAAQLGNLASLKMLYENDLRVLKTVV